MSKTINLPYGKHHQKLINDDNQYKIEIITPPATPAHENPTNLIESALHQVKDLEKQKIKLASTIAIAINDKTRPVPHHVILPPLLKWLIDLRSSTKGIKLWIATGSHVPMKPDEYTKIIPSNIVDRYDIESHDINCKENLIQLGVTSRGTPAIINRRFYETEYKIVVGDIEPHHFAGFSGGYKTAAIGFAGWETINHNHAMLVDPDSWIGIYDQNPLRQDINEIGRMVGVDLALNTILNLEKEVVYALADHPDQVMDAGIKLSRKVCGTPEKRKFRLVVASAGGFPKDINFYQAQKALTHASLFCQPGGTIILAAECPEGTGSASYEEFMRGLGSTDEVFTAFKELGFRVGPHKAYQVARLLNNFTIVMVSSISPEKIKALLMEPAPSVQEAFNTHSRHLDPGEAVAVLPHATTTIPG
jgi:nickel-dependent lactate racemase